MNSFNNTYKLLFKIKYTKFYYNNYILFYANHQTFESSFEGCMKDKHLSSLESTFR